MIYLKYVYDIVAVVAIVFFIFHPKDVLGFWVVSVKKVAIGIYNLLKRFVPK